MSPDKGPERVPEEWLRSARSDLALASIALPDEVMLEALSFHAQQAAEKALKAVLVKVGVAFPFTHDLAVLVGLVSETVEGWDAALDEVATLTDYAVLTRYLGAEEPVTEDELAAAIVLAERVVAWAERTMKRHAG
ncbi:MAG: HEPN domain-containing protein [Candidatus Sericytochromatia bacterium]|nr:HEPN domain-containing protein [Candidatus Tanganyikabacteria bacterium]